jgi:hypothetical protein
VNSHACVIAVGSSAAVASSATASAWPTTSSQTVMIAATGANRGCARFAPLVAISPSSTTVVTAPLPAAAPLAAGPAVVAPRVGAGRRMVRDIVVLGGVLDPVVPSGPPRGAGDAGSTGASAASTRTATSSGVPSASTTT